MANNDNLDNAGRRLGGDRRQFTYYIHIPERRSGMERRSGIDRRTAAFYHRGDKERRQMVQ